MSDVYDLTGRKFGGTLRVTLRPGFGVSHDDKHFEGGPHELPLRLGVDLVNSGRAFISPDDEPPVVAVEPTVETRDPEVRKRR